MAKRVHGNRIFFFAGACILLYGSLSMGKATPQIYNGQRGQSFDTGWKFNLGDVSGAQGTGFNDAAWRSLNVPHDWSIELPFDSTITFAGQDGTEGYLAGGIGWYRKTFSLPQSYSGNRILIEFDGVYMNSTVYINGDSIGVMPYGYSTYEFDLTTHVTYGATSNVLAVRVNHQQPGSRWYPGSGIYRNVWLTVLNPVHIASCGTFVTTPSVSAGSASVAVSSQVQNQSTVSQTITLATSITDSNGLVVASNTSPSAAVAANGLDTILQNLTITNPNLWSTTSPYLYNVKTVVSDNGAAIDSFFTTMGIRTISYDANNGFFLNGQHLKIYGFCNHHCVSGLGAAINYRALQWFVEKLIPTGCNAIRTSHNPPAPELLDVCDRLGIMVMEESFDTWDVGKNTYDYHQFFPQWAQIDIRNMVRRDRNHPSIIMWSTGNEVLSNNMLTNATNLRNWVRNDDTTRPVTWARDNWETGDYTAEFNIFDIAGCNYYEQDLAASHTTYPTRKIFGSENQGSTSAFFDIYGNQFVAGGFFWTGFDYQGEAVWPDVRATGGRVNTCGFIQNDYYLHKSQWETAPLVKFSSPNWNWGAGTTQTVTVYSNCDTVELLLNATSLGSKSINNEVGVYDQTWSVPFAAGTLKAVGLRGGAIVATDSIKTTGAAAGILLTPDRSRISAIGNDLSFVTVAVVDANGLTVPTAANSINFSCSGVGTIVSVDNGNPLNYLSMKGSVCPAYNGLCLVIVQSNGTAGNVTLTATSSPLPTSSVSIACTTATTGIRGMHASAGEAGTMEIAAHMLNGATDICYKVPSSGFLHLNIYDTKGRLVKQLSNGYQKAGDYHIIWDKGDSKNGQTFARGVYYCRLLINNASLTKTIVRMGN
jgi:beta-galactosidase